MINSMIEFYGRAVTGRKIKEEEFDIEILPRKLEKLIEKYEVFYNPGEAVPQDLNMAARVFEAAVELIKETGIYCRDTNSVIKVEEGDIKRSLTDATDRYVIGKNAEAAECYSRNVSDKRSPRIIGGPCGAPLSEENYIDILTSYANEAIEGLHTGALQSLFGKKIRAGTPLEFMACQYEALWAREAIKRAGKPGMALLGIMSGITSEGQNAGDFPGGLRPSDMHLVTFLNDLKVDWEVFKKIIHCQNLSNSITACCIQMLGGYSGGPEGTAITGVAEAIVGYVMAKPRSFVSATETLALNHLDIRPLWVSCMIPLAFISAGVDICLDVYVGGYAGPCTDMLCNELVAETIAYTASGFSALYGGSGCMGAKKDYGTGMESRIILEASRAAAGISLSAANEIVRELMKRVQEETSDGKKPPIGKSFTECYDKELNPCEEYITLWERKKKDLKTMGLERVIE